MNLTKRCRYARRYCTSDVRVFGEDRTVIVVEGFADKVVAAVEYCFVKDNAL
jgi:hypothetical protein